jgi:hypothetical protein
VGVQGVLTYPEVGGGLAHPAVQGLLMGQRAAIPARFAGDGGGSQGSAPCRLLRSTVLPPGKRRRRVWPQYLGPAAATYPQ